MALYYNIKHCIIDDCEASLDKQVVFDADLQNCLNMVFSEGYLGVALRRVIDIDCLKRKFYNDAVNYSNYYNAKNVIIYFITCWLRYVDPKKIEEYIKNEYDFLMKPYKRKSPYIDMGSHIFTFNTYETYLFEKYYCDYYNYSNYEDYMSDPKLYINNLIDKLMSMKDEENPGEISYILTFANNTEKIIKVNGFIMYPRYLYQFGIHNGNNDILRFESELGNFIYDSSQRTPFTLYSNNLKIERDPNNIYMYIISEQIQTPGE